MKVSSLQKIARASGYYFDGKRNYQGMYSMLTDKGKISADTVEGLYKLFFEARRSK